MNFLEFTAGFALAAAVGAAACQALKKHYRRDLAKLADELSPCSTVSVPIYMGQEVTGVLGADIKLA